MSFQYDSTGVDPDSKGGRQKVPPGTYKFRIQSVLVGQSRNGDPNVALECEVLDNLEQSGKMLAHWVTFLPKDNPGAGIAVHFLKALGESWEGVVSIEPDNWVGKTFLGKVQDQPFVSKRDGKTYVSSKIVGVDYASPDNLEDIFSGGDK